MFKSNVKKLVSVRLINYIDDIAIIVSSKTIRQNCRLLQNAAIELIK